MRVKEEGLNRLKQVRLSVCVMLVVNILLEAKMKLPTSNLAETLEVLARRFLLKMGQIG